MKTKLKILLLLFAVLGAFVFSLTMYIENRPSLGPAIVEQFYMRNVEFISNNSVVATVENTGGNSPVYTVVFVSASINGTNATLTPSRSPAGTLKAGATMNFNVTLQGNSHFIPDNAYKVKLQTIKGTIAFLTVTYNKTT